jgi:hypothetical protein
MNHARGVGHNAGIQPLSSLRLAQLAAGISVVMLGLQVWRLAVWLGIPCGPSGFGRWVLPILALVPPYLSVVARPRSQNLAFISLWGALSGIAAVTVIFAAAQPSGERIRTYVDFLGWSAFAVLQLILVVNAERAITAAAEERPRLGTSAFHVLTYVFLILLPAFFLVDAVRVRPSPGAFPEASAIGRLRTVNAGQAAYAGAHPDRGYAATFDELREQRFVSPDIGVAEYGYGYQLSMSAGPRDPSGRISSYQAWADKTPPQGMCRNLFTDQSGTVYFTREQRRASAADTPIQ